MAENIREEIRRLHRTKRLFVNHHGNMEQMQDSESSGSEMGAESPRRPESPPSAIKNPEMALFTFKQVSRKKRVMTSESAIKILTFYILTFSGANDMRAHAEGERGEASRAVRCSVKQ